MNDSLHTPAPQDTPELTASLARALVRTSGFRAIIRALVPEVLDAWAGSSRSRKALARLIGRDILKSFDAAGDDAGRDALADLMHRPDIARRLGELLPEALNAAIDTAAAAIDGIASLPPREASGVARAVAETVDAKRAGEIVTGLVRCVARVHEDDPTFFSKALQPCFRSWIEGIDFGEVKETVDRSSDDIAATVAMANRELWRYPAKVICLLSLIPSIVAILARSATETVKPLNELAPDLLTDVVLSFVREIDGAHVGALINELSELVRKIHTGSALIGDAGNPLLPQTVAALAGSTLDAVDVHKLVRARSLIRDLGETTFDAVLEKIEQRPELARELFFGHFTALAAFARRWAAKTEAVERLFDDDALAAEFARGLHELDMQELAATAGRFCALLNRIHGSSPGVVRDLLSQFFGSLDGYEARETAEWLMADIVESIKPIAPEVLPPVLNGIADLITPDDGRSDELARSVARLRDAILGAEVKSK